MNPTVAARSPKMHDRRLRHALLRDLTAEELAEARKRGYITERIYQSQRYVRGTRRATA